MSFYDNIKIDSRQLPLSDADVQRLKSDRANFQTQSLEGMYGVYEITTDGYLEKTAAFKTLGTAGRTTLATCSYGRRTRCYCVLHERGR